MIMRRVFLTAIAAFALLPSGAGANPGTLIRDCLQNGKVTGHYSPSDYRQALADLPTDVAEYSDCAAVIRGAQLANAAGGSLAASAAAGTVANTLQDPLATAAPAERAAVIKARRTGGAPLLLNGTLVRPGVVAVHSSAFLHRLPTPLLLALGALLSIVLSVSGRRLWDLVRTRRST
ncbi:MAG: hypothetical protein NVSMB51_00040 [Solirubrobacteraceae bacterium]